MLSVAPLIGSEAYIDSTHKRWLHVRVRPNARGMLKTIKVGSSPFLIPLFPWPCLVTTLMLVLPYHA